MVEVTGKHAAKHVSGKEVSPDSLKVKFSPELSENLSKVMVAVRYSRDFDKGDLFSDLKNFASGQMNARTVVRMMKDITEGIEKHTVATKDFTAKEAWDEFTIQMMGLKTPFTLVQHQKGRTQH